MKASVAKKLSNMIISYGFNKKKLKEIQGTVDMFNSEIKDIMTKEDLSEYSVEGWKVTFKVVERMKVDEDLLMDIIKKLGIKGVIKKREYIDHDALEKLIYNGKISEKDIAALDKANIVTEVPTLWVKEVK